MKKYLPSSLSTKLKYSFCRSVRSDVVAGLRNGTEPPFNTVAERNPIIAHNGLTITPCISSTSIPPDVLLIPSGVATIKRDAVQQSAGDAIPVVWIGYAEVPPYRPSWCYLYGFRSFWPAPVCSTTCRTPHTYGDGCLRQASPTTTIRPNITLREQRQSLDVGRRVVPASICHCTVSKLLRRSQQKRRYVV